MSKKMIVVLGGARSGKTQYAQDRATQLGGRVIYVATATADDDEMRERIGRHRAARPATWQTLERAIQLGEAMRQLVCDVVIVDCVTLWLSNVLLALSDAVTTEQAEAHAHAESSALLDAWRVSDYTLILVSNEVGLGLVPPYPLGRIYRDLLGRVNQQLAQAADEVIFMVAGLPMRLKG